MLSSSSQASVKVDKATSNLLIGPDWTVNMEICDSVNSNQWQAKDVVKCVKKRLQQKNPRVQFLALTLLETMIKNCGDFVHFQVVEREILQEMIKIVKKKTDMQVRDKILLLLDSWQEAFGGPQGKYPQYYFAYAELKNSGVHFPQNSSHSAPVFTPPITHPATSYPPAGHGMSRKPSLRLDEAMASDVGDLSLSELDSIQRVIGLLSDMLQAVNSNNRKSVKDEVIVDLISQSRSNQKKIINFVGSTRDEEMLAQALELNDNLQYLIAKHDAIASGSALPIKGSEPIPRSEAAPSASESENQQVGDEEVEDDDDGFAELAQRNYKIKPDQSSSMVGKCEQEASPTTSTDSASKTEALSSTMTNALVLSDDHLAAPVSTATKMKEQDMIDLLSMTLSLANPSPSPHTSVTPPSGLSLVPTSFQTQQENHPENLRPSHNPQEPRIPQQFQVNQSGTPSYINYVAPWAQQTLPQPPWQQQQQPQPQYQYQQYSSSYPSPPWESSSSVSYQQFAPHANMFGNQTPAVNASRPVNIPLESRKNIIMTASAVSTPATTSKPFVPSYRLFEDLIDFRTADERIKATKNTASNLSSKKTP